MRQVSIVSTDGHAVLPAELWPDYLERRFHEYLPALRADDEINRRSMYPLNDAMMVPALDVFDTDGVYRAEGWKGAWDADVRLAELDREGVAAELVYHGFFRVADLGFSVMNATYPDDLVDAGARAHNRWAFDTFGARADRFLLVGAIGTTRPRRSDRRDRLDRRPRLRRFVPRRLPGDRRNAAARRRVLGPVLGSAAPSVTWR